MFNIPLCYLAESQISRCLSAIREYGEELCLVVFFLILCQFRAELIDSFCLLFLFHLPTHCIRFSFWYMVNSVDLFFLQYSPFAMMMITLRPVCV